MFVVEPSSVGVGDDIVMGGDVSKVGSKVLVVVWHLVVGSCQVVRENGPGPKAFGIDFGVVGDDLFQIISGGNVVWRRHLVFDITIFGAFPVAIPSRLMSSPAARALPFVGVVRVEAGVGPCCADDCAAKGAGVVPLILVSELLANPLGNLEARRALLEAVAAGMV